MDGFNGLPRRPFLPDVGIVALVPDAWQSPWQPRHQILSRLSEYFNVVWVEPAVYWRHVLRGRREDRRVANSVGMIPLRFSVYSPERWLPQFFRPTFLARFTASERLRRARRILRRRGAEKLVLYLWRPEFGAAIELIRSDLTCYHIDDEYSFSPFEQPLDSREVKLIRDVGQVFIHSPALLEKKGGLNPHTRVIPNGVDYSSYASPREEPADLAPIPHPRIGYVGVIKTQLDWELLIRLVDQHRAWSFVFVGPRGYLGDSADAVDQLSRRPNVYLLGGRPLDALPSYTQHFDVCILPYRIDGYTKFIYPLKLHEYLAAGKPVVGSRIRTLEDFSSVIGLAETPAEWSEAIERSLTAMAASWEQVAIRCSIAEEFDWGKITDLVAQSICEGLGGEYLHRFRILQQQRDLVVESTAPSKKILFRQLRQRLSGPGPATGGE
jgi:glycosyltransferase involved in cell wall biosynthesis